MELRQKDRIIKSTDRLVAIISDYLAMVVPYAQLITRNILKFQIQSRHLIVTPRIGNNKLSTGSYYANT